MDEEGDADAADELDELVAIRGEVRFELGLLHQRVNALLAAEAFLTIAYTAAMSSTQRWVPLVAPLLALLGLLLAALSWPGVRSTARLIVRWTTELSDYGDDHPAVRPVWYARLDRRRRDTDQRRSLLFFRAVPVLFVVVWAVLLAVALVERG